MEVMEVFEKLLEKNNIVKGIFTCNCSFSQFFFLKEEKLEQEVKLDFIFSNGNFNLLLDEKIVVIFYKNEYKIGFSVNNISFVLDFPNTYTPAGVFTVQKVI
jgi:hypothetical protein